MKPKSKLIMLSVCFAIITGMLVWCLTKGNTFGAAVDVIILLYYTPQIVWAYKDMKRER